MRDLNLKRGLTLIEVIVYIALFSIVLSGAVLSAYHMIESSGRTSDKVAFDEDLNFIRRKIDWVLSDVDTINDPKGSTSLQELSLNKIGYANNPIQLHQSGNLIEINERGDWEALNSSTTPVSNLRFTATGGVNGIPYGIEVSFNFDGENFETIKYVR